MSDDQRPVPLGWVEAKLEDIAEVIRGITFPSSDKRHEPYEGSVVCLRTTNVQDQLEWDDVLYIPRKYVKSSDRWLQEFDSVISMANSFELVGKVALARQVPAATTFGGFIAAIRSRGVDPRFLFFALREPEAKERIRRTSSRTVNIANISAKNLNAAELRIPPLAEQHRIVSKIEALQERSGRAAKALADVGPLLEQFRQSILAAAFSGRLTADWREKRRTFVEDEPRRMDIPVRLLSSHDPSNHEEISDKNVQATRGEENEVSDRNVQATNKTDETAAELLARIRTERCRRWEHAELAKYKVKGKQPPKDWMEKYEEPGRIEVTEPCYLPAGWCWTEIEAISDWVKDGTHWPPKTTEAGIPFIGIRNVIGGRIDWRTVDKWVSAETHAELTANFPHRPGDVLYTAVGATFGRAFSIDDDRKFMF